MVGLRYGDDMGVGLLARKAQPMLKGPEVTAWLSSCGSRSWIYAGVRNEGSILARTACYSIYYCTQYRIILCSYGPVGSLQHFASEAWATLRLCGD